MRYRLATHARSGHVEFVLDDGALAVHHEKSGKRRVIPFADVREINVRRDLPGVFSVIVRPVRGAAVTVPSRHFEAVGAFHARNAEYAAFLDELHRGVAAANPRARFVAGASWLFVFGIVELAFGLALAALFAHSALVAGRPVPRRAIAVIVVVTVIALLFIAQGRSKPYEPGAIPAKFVP